MIPVLPALQMPATNITWRDCSPERLTLPQLGRRTGQDTASAAEASHRKDIRNAYRPK